MFPLQSFSNSFRFCFSFDFEKQSTKTVNFSSEAFPKIPNLEMSNSNCSGVFIGGGKSSVGFLLVQKTQKQKFDKSKLHFVMLEFSGFQTYSKDFIASIQKPRNDGLVREYG